MALHSIEARATDSGLYGPRYRSVRLEARVLDVNDNAPIFEKFPYKAEVPLGLEAGAAVVKVSAMDKDAGANGRVFYMLAEPSPYFMVRIFVCYNFSPSCFDPAIIIIMILFPYINIYIISSLMC